MSSAAPRRLHMHGATTSVFAPPEDRAARNATVPPPPSIGAFRASLHTHRPLTNIYGSAASAFVGRVCGDLLNPCIGQKGGAPGHGRCGTLRLRASRWAALEACTGHALCSAMQLPYSTALGVARTSGALIVLLTGDGRPSPFAADAGRCCRRL